MSVLCEISGYYHFVSVHLYQSGSSQDKETISNLNKEFNIKNYLL